MDAPGIPNLADTPGSIFFFPNGSTAVCSLLGAQMPQYQRGSHADTVKALAADGYWWEDLPERHGVPRLGGPYNAGRGHFFGG